MLLNHLFLSNLLTHNQHSYMKYLYKYPQNEFPYEDLIKTNAGRSKLEREYNIIDSKIFDDNKYTVEVDGYSIPAGSSQYDSLDVFYSAGLGTLTVPATTTTNPTRRRDPSTGRPVSLSGQSWSPAPTLADGPRLMPGPPATLTP